MQHDKRQTAMNWFTPLSSLEKTRLCDIHTELVGSVRRWETLTGREVEMIYEAEHPSTERNGDKEGEELGITPGEWKVAMNGNSVWSNNVTTICQLEQLPEQMANATLIASAPTLKADNERLLKQSRIDNQYQRDLDARCTALLEDNKALRKAVGKMLKLLKCIHPDSVSTNEGVEELSKLIQEAETLLNNK